jgi:5-methylcytosine-specific restriction endonuclease McrA
MSGEQQQGEAERTRLSNHINAARQLTQGARGRELDAVRADTIAAFLRAAQQLARAAQKAPQGEAPPSLAVDTEGRRFGLWQRDPRCMWCGRVTRIESQQDDNAATLDHLHPRGHRAGKRIRSVLACRRCNGARGQPKAITNDVCPVVEQTRRAA